MRSFSRMTEDIESTVLVLLLPQLESGAPTARMVCLLYWMQKRRWKRVRRVLPKVTYWGEFRRALPRGKPIANRLKQLSSLRRGYSGQTASRERSYDTTLVCAYA